MKFFYWVFIFILVFINSFSQNNVQVRYDYDASGNAIFGADNYLNFPVYLVLDFSSLNFASFSEDLPYIRRIEPGSTQLFTILREPDQPSPQISIEYKWYNSDPSPINELHFPYLIPAKPGSIVNIVDLKIKGKERSAGFILKQSDEVFASRKGIVVYVFENYNQTQPLDSENQQNFVHILHDDGTIGEYFNFSYQGINCELGQKVFPGHKLGRAALGSDGLPVIGFSLFHSQLNSKNLAYLVLEFCTEKSKVEQLSVSHDYKVIHPIEIIEKELSRKERKILSK